MECRVVIALVVFSMVACSHDTALESNSTLPALLPPAVLQDLTPQACSLPEQRDSVREEINQQVHALIEETVVPAILGCNPALGSSINNTAASCAELCPDKPPGYYWVGGSDAAAQVYCDADRECCGVRGGWARVAHLNMTDDNQHCPSNWLEITSPIRVCTRRTENGCDSVTFSTHRISYSHVCGRILGYQYCKTDAFAPYYIHPATTTIDDTYVDGVSITHGNPRKHVWTFAAGRSETHTGNAACPCDNPSLGSTPSFVGDNYFCETATVRSPGGDCAYFTNDTLWDGQGCGSESSCCEFNTPPWFCRALSEPTTDDIEVRICANARMATEDSPVQLVELYVR